MNVVHLPLDRIESNPKNYRLNYQGIEKLADLIAQYGLLQNLLIWEYEPGKYHVKGGERRLRALRVLKERGHPVADELVHCVLLSEFTVQDVVENEARKQPALWELGARYAEMYDDAGLTQTQISVKCGTTPTLVSLCILLHKRIHPRVRALLSKQGPDCLAVHHLERIAAARGPGEEPDEDKQLELLERFLDDRTKPRRVRKSGELRSERELILDRARRILKTHKVPLHAQGFMQVIQEYLLGTRKKLRF